MATVPKSEDEMRRAFEAYVRSKTIDGSDCQTPELGAPDHEGARPPPVPVVHCGAGSASRVARWHRAQARDASGREPHVRPSDNGDQVRRV